MYESPIQTVFSGIEIKPLVDAAGEYIVRAVQRMDVQVDKEELIKALKYDRDQYLKGLEDGRRYRPPVKNNYDRLTHLSVEDLASYLEHLQCSWKPIYDRRDKAEWIAWLLQEVEAE